MRKTHVLFFFAPIGILALAPRCGGGSSDCTQTSTCPSEASEGPPPLVCDMTQDPKNAPGCLDDRVGIFVSPTGSDTNAGTKAAPFQTIGKALASVGSLTRVYVCEGTYAEDVTIAAPVDGVSIYGGFSCADWSYTGNKPTVGKGTIALTVSGTTKPFSIEDLAFKSADGMAGAPSSIAALVANASGAVTFVRDALTAGNGATGADAKPAANYDSTLLQNDPKIAGATTTSGAAGAAQACANLCTDAVTSTGGSGGAGGTGTQGGQSGSPSLGGSAPNDGAGGSGGATCTPGDNGADRTAAGGDATSPTALGALDATGWTATTSSSGTNGAPGQGGGGGGGASFANNTAGGGGGGGCGGCGGAGGPGGVAGGSSIALAVFTSTVSVNGCDLVAGNGGNGGKGAAGQTGQSGGFKGKGATPGCDGGNGGNGSAGGSGAGGVGGISVGVLFKGNAPAVDSSTTNTVGTAGAAGTGGTPGTNDGIAGVAVQTRQSP
jgi:hypothetical protein